MIWPSRIGGLIRTSLPDMTVAYVRLPRGSGDATIIEIKYAMLCGVPCWLAKTGPLPIHVIASAPTEQELVDALLELDEMG